jgi:hypothetical protein
MVIVDNWYYPNWTRPYYPYNSRALTVIHKDQLRAKNISQAALRGNSLKNFDKITLTAQGQTLKPASGQGITKKTGGAPAAGAERTIKAPAAKSLEPATPPTLRPADRGGQAGAVSSGERRIRSKDSSQAQGSGTPKKQSGSAVRKNSFGYPPSPSISIKKYSDRSRTSSSIRNRFYQSLGKSGSSSKGSSKSGSVSRGSSSSGSKGSRGSVSSGSRGSSSGSRSSGSRSSGGSVRKKG